MPPKKATKASEPSNPLAGKVICFTGALTQNRKEASKQAEALGATVSGTVTAKTNILVAGPGAGSKIEAAEKKGVEIWDEAQFQECVATAGGSDAATTASAAPAKKGKKTAVAMDVEEEEEEPVKPKKVPAKKGKKAAVEENEEEEPAPKKAPAKKAPAKAKGKRAKVEDDEEEEADEVVEEEAKPEPPAKKAKAEKKVKAEAPPPPPAAATVSSSSSSSSSSRGARAPDRAVGSGYNVYQDYDTKLMQTNITGTAQGNNKFYIIQVLEKGGQYYNFTRWGRLGEEGQNKMEPCGPAAAAVKAFEKKFKDKSANNWNDVCNNSANFVKKDGKYGLVVVEDGEGGGDALLGKLSEEQIMKGKLVLDEIKALLDTSSSKSGFAKLSSQFYSLIPTNTGRKAPPVIDNATLHGEKEALLDFWLRMGFEDAEEEGVTPLSGVMERPVPETLESCARSISDAFSIQSSVARGQELQKAKAGNPVKAMPVHMYASILLYTGNSIYADLNKQLRAESKAGVRKYLDYLRLILEAMTFMPQSERTLWRGISVDLYEQYEVGKTITWWAFSSCTADVQVARNFMSGCGGPCTLLTVKSKTAMDVSALSFYANEKESLLAPGTQLRVISRKRVGIISEIEVEEVGRLIE